MRGVVKKWGNSAAVRIPASVLEGAKLRLDQPVDVREEGGRIVIEPLHPPRYDIDALVAGITDDNRHEAIDTAEPQVGKSGSGGGLQSRRGGLVWLQFDPQAGHEQAGHRPAVVLSPAGYDNRVGMIVCCPTTTRIKGYPFEVALGGTPASVVLADQVKSQDWRARRATRKGRVSAGELAEVRAKLVALIG